MSKFQSFCKNIHKNKHGYVPDLLDLESDQFRDLAMAAFLDDKFGAGAGARYLSAVSDKAAINDIYAVHESECQDAIDAYNQTIDDEREKAKNLELIDDDAWISMIDPDYKYRHFNQSMFDAGHKPSDFC
jgi:hypothetical protein